MRRSTFILVTCLLAPLAAAQMPQVELRVDTRKLEVDEAADAELICTNTGVPGVPRTTVPDGLDLRLLNETPFSSSQISIINGRRSEKTEYRYQLQLIALKEGVYQLGPISVEADGRTYETKLVTIIVSKRDDMGQRGDRDMFVEIEVAPKSLYVTESYTATLTIGIRKVEIDGRVYDLNLLGQIDGRGSQLSVFGGRFSSTETTLTDSAGQRHRYVLYREIKQIRAEDVGETAVGPVFLRMEYPTALRRGWFSSLEVSRSRKATARAPAVSVEVKGPPEEDRPAGFTGAIGRYTMDVSARPLRVEQNQPITLAIAIRGEPVSGIAGPDLSRNAELASRFEFARDELVGELEADAKVFRRAVFPKQPGEQTVPPIRWSYFNPRTEEYVTLTSEPINVTVDPPTARTTTIAVATERQNAPEETTLTLLTGGISPNHVDPALVLASQSFVLTKSWLTALVLPPIACLMVVLTARHHRRVRTDRRYARRRHAQRQADSLVKTAIREKEHAQQLAGLGRAVTRYISDRFDLPPGPLTPVEAHEVLIAHAADTTLAEEIRTFLQDCDALRYAPSSTDSVPGREAAARVRAWISRMERTTR